MAGRPSDGSVVIFKFARLLRLTRSLPSTVWKRAPVGAIQSEPRVGCRPESGMSGWGAEIRATSKSKYSREPSFGLDLHGLEDFTPLGYLSPDEVGEFLGSARRDVHGVEALAQLRLGQHLADTAGEP